MIEITDSNHNNPLELFWTISESLVSKQYLQEILHLIVTLTAHAVNTNICSIMLLDESTQELRIVSTQALSEAYAKKGHVKVGESVSGKALKENRTIVVHDVAKDPSYAFPKIARDEGLVSMVSVPMKYQSKIIGVINCYTKKTHNFTDAEIKLLQAVANQAAVAIENTRLQDENISVKRALEERKIIDQAKSILMEQQGIKESEAYRLIQKTSRDRRISMAEVARAILLVGSMKTP